jgi:hypothetical protein
MSQGFASSELHPVRGSQTEAEKALLAILVSWVAHLGLIVRSRTLRLICLPSKKRLVRSTTAAASGATPSLSSLIAAIEFHLNVGSSPAFLLWYGRMVYVAALVAYEGAEE